MKKLLLTFVCLLTAIGIASAADNVKTEAMYRSATNVGQLADDMKAWPDAVNPLSLDFASAGLSWDGTSNIRGGYLYWNAGNTMTLTPKEGYKVVGLKVGGYSGASGQCSAVLADASVSSGAISTDGTCMVWTGDVAAGSTLTIKSNSTSEAYANYVVVSYVQEGGTGGDVTLGAKEFVFTSNTDYKYTGESPSKSWEGMSLNSSPVLKTNDFSLTWSNYTVSNASGYLTWAYSNTTMTVTAKPGVTISEIVFSNTPNTTGGADLYDKITVSSGTKSQSGTTGEDFVWKGTCDVNNPVTFTKNGIGTIGQIQYILVKYKVEALTSIDKPTINPDGGSVDQLSHVSISAMDGATIEYCLSQDGAENWEAYTGEVTLTEVGNWTLKARATYNGVVSDVAEANFTVNKLTKISSGFVLTGKPTYGNAYYTGEYPATVYDTALTYVVADGCAKLSWNEGGLAKQSGWFNINADAVLTITPEAGTSITKVIFNGYDQSYAAPIASFTPSAGALTQSGSNVTWEGSVAEPLTFTATAKASYVQYIVVEYTKDLTQGGGDDQPQEGGYAYVMDATYAQTQGLPKVSFNPSSTDSQLVQDGLYTLSWSAGAVSGTSLKRNGTFTVTPEAGVEITEIAINGYQYDGDYNFTTDVDGTINHGGGSFSWTGSSNTPVTVTFGASAYYAGSIVVKYKKTQGAAETVADPEISPEKGTYKVGQLVTITAEEGATVQYSVAATDAAGTTVTWREYTAPFALEAGKWTVSAKALKGSVESQVVSVEYTVNKEKCVLSFAEANYSAVMGTTFESPAVVNDANLTLTWSSDNDKVATVDNTGKVTLVGAGTAVIKAAFAGDAKIEAGEATYTLTVARQVPDFKFAADKAEYTFGTEFTAPELTNTQNLEVTWSSSNEEVATVDAEGKVTFVAAGEVTIKATGAQTATCEGAEASYTVTVNRQEAEFKFSAESVELKLDEEFKAPELINPANLEVTWSSSNEEVATVDAEGKVTIKSMGEATIKAVGAETGVYKGAEAEYKIVVHTSGIRSITIDDTENAIYTLNGVRVSGEELTPGIYILVKDGKVTKIAVK